MVIHLSNEVLDGLDDPHVAAVVNLVVSLIILRKHEWHIAPTDNLRALNNDRFSGVKEFVQHQITKLYEGPPLPKSRRMLRIVPDGLVEEKATRAASDPGAICRTHVAGQRTSVTRDDRRLDVISLNLVTPYLTECLKIAVENLDSDGAFIRTILKHHEGMASDKVDDILGFEFAHGGGSTVSAVVANLAGRRRAMCIVDNDRDHAGTVTKDKQQLQKDLEELCDQLGYDFVVLKKREIENYLPDTAVKAWLKEKGFYFVEEHPYFTLPDEVRDYVDCGKMWKPDKNAPVGSELAATRDVSLDRCGFGKEVWEAFSYVSSFEELETRDKIGELRDIVEVIKNNL